jgi:phage terminase small subunit
MRCRSSLICADRDDGFEDASALLQVSMRLTTLVEILEREIGVSPSARSKLALLVAEHGQKEPAAQARPGAAQGQPHGSMRDRSAGRAG